jgi:hypothetical protein
MGAATGSGGMAGAGGAGGGQGGMAGTGGAGGQGGGQGGMAAASGSGGQGGSGGGSLSPAEVCLHLCTLIEQCSGMSGCEMGCSTDLLDCDAAQLQTLDNCQSQFIDCQNIQPLLDCLQAVACVDG